MAARPFSQQAIYLRLYKAIWMVCSASSKKSTHLVFDEKPMPKAVLFQGVYEFSRHEKRPEPCSPGLIELEAISQAAGLAKVALQQTLKGLAVTGLIASHLVDGVVDGIEVSGLGTLGEISLTGGGAILGLNAHLEVLLGGVGHDLAQELGELGGVLGLLMSCLLVIKTNLGITLAMGDTGHGQVHTDLGALALKVGTQVVDDVLGHALLGNAHDVLGSPGKAALILLQEAGTGNAALGALKILGQLVAVVLFNITANGANKLHDSIPSIDGDGALVRSRKGPLRTCVLTSSIIHK